MGSWATKSCSHFPLHFYRRQQTWWRRTTRSDNLHFIFSRWKHTYSFIKSLKAVTTGAATRRDREKGSPRVEPAVCSNQMKRWFRLVEQQPVGEEHEQRASHLQRFCLTCGVFSLADGQVPQKRKINASRIWAHSSKPCPFLPGEIWEMDGLGRGLGGREQVLP